MIELSWKDIYDKEYDPLTYVTNLLAWLASTIAEESKNHSVYLTSYIVVRESETKISTLVLCDGEKNAEKIVLDLLLKPPDEYKDKYVPCILSEEPIPIQETPPSIETNTEEEDEAEMEIILDSDSESEKSESRQ